MQVRVFCGYTTERGCIITNERYISNNQALVGALRRALGTSEALNPPRRTFVLASQMGTGKSQILQQLSCLQPQTTVLIVSMRRLLSESLFKRLEPDVPLLQHYISAGTAAATAPRLVIQLDSMRRLVRGNQVNKYDVVVLEEIRSLLAHLSSSTLADKRRAVSSIFTFIVSKARLLLALDADMDECAYHFLRSVRSDSVWSIYRNIATPCARTHLVYKNEVTWHNYLLHTLQRGDNVYMASNSKKRINGWAKQAVDRGISHRAYTSNTPQRDKLEVSQCNTTWLDYQLVMFSPVISAGLDMSQEHFHLGTGWFSNSSAVPRECLQQLGRVRIMVDGACIIAVYIYAPAVRENLEFVDSIEGCLAFLNDNLGELHKYGALSMDRTSIDQDTGVIRLTMDDPIDYVLVSNTLESIRSKRNFLAEYRLRALMHGDTVVYIGDDDEQNRDDIPPEQLSRRDIRDCNDAANFTDTLALSQTSRSDDMLEAIADQQTGDGAVAPYALTQDRWCALLNCRKSIDDIAVCDWIKRPGALLQLTSYLLAFHPSPDEAYSYLGVGYFSSFRAPTTDPLAVFFQQKLPPYQTMIGGYDGLVQRADLVRSFVSSIVNTTQPVPAHACIDEMNRWLKDGRNAELLKMFAPSRIPWGGAGVKRANVKQAVDNVLGLVGMRSMQMHGALVIDDESWVLMSTLAALCTRDPVYEEMRLRAVELAGITILPAEFEAE
jgi:hypothetical protein